MARFGYEMPVPALDMRVASIVQLEHSALSGMYGVPDLPTARKYGYRPPPQPDFHAAQGEPPQGTWEDAATVERDRVLHGEASDAPPSGKATTGTKPAPGGCAGEASRKLLTDNRHSVYGLGHTLWVESTLEVGSSEVAKTVHDEWASCMRRAGHRATTPLELASSYASRLDLPEDMDLALPPGPREVELAVADVRCKEEVDLVERMNAHTAAVGRALIKEHRAALTEDRVRLDKQIALAAEVFAQKLG